MTDVRGIIAAGAEAYGDGGALVWHTPEVERALLRAGATVGPDDTYSGVTAAGQPWRVCLVRDLVPWRVCRDWDAWTRPA